MGLQFSILTPQDTPKELRCAGVGARPLGVPREGWRVRVRAKRLSVERWVRTSALSEVSAVPPDQNQNLTQTGLAPSGMSVPPELHETRDQNRPAQTPSGTSGPLEQLGLNNSGSPAPSGMPAPLNQDRSRWLNGSPSPSPSLSSFPPSQICPSCQLCQKIHCQTTSTETQAQPLWTPQPANNSGCEKRMLDLFSGTGSVGKVFEEQGYRVISLDREPVWKADLPIDIMEWDYRALPPGHFQVIAASPPCTEFSSAKTTAPRDLAGADRLVQRTLEIIHYFKPQKWWIENPRTGLLATRPYMADYPFVDTDYCQYSDWGY